MRPARDAGSEYGSSSATALLSHTARNGQTWGCTPLASRRLFVLLAVVLAATLTTLALWSTSWPYTLESWRRPTSTRRLTHCVMYDKAPRTGSTTILRALRRCWTAHRYRFSRHRRSRNQSFVSSALGISCSIPSSGRPVTSLASSSIATGITSPTGVYHKYINRRFDPPFRLKSISASSFSNRVWSSSTKTCFRKGRRRRLAIAGNHFIISRADATHIRNSCDRLFYVTSTRDMRSRMLSRAKYDLALGAHVTNNRTLNDYRMQRAFMYARSAEGIAMETALEKYPFRKRVSFTPDYIIRSENFENDLTILLEAFGCRSSFSTVNVHEYDPYASPEATEEPLVFDGESGIDEVSDFSDLSVIPLSFGDARHKRLLRQARKGNRRGLRKAMSFRLKSDDDIRS